MSNPTADTPSNPVFRYCQLADVVIGDAHGRFESDDYPRSRTESDAWFKQSLARLDELRGAGEDAIAAGVRAGAPFPDMERRVEDMRLSCEKLLQWRPFHRHFFYGDPPQPAEAVY